MENTIKSELGKIESSNGIKIIYACESGSRAWGFPSANSDYDVRFIYIRPLEWYLSIDEKGDVIDIPINNSLDISGWDLKKALQLLRKTNPPLLEWLMSPIVYFENEPIIQKMRELAKDFYFPSTCLYHYYHMAQHNYKEYLQGDIVWLKKYFYVLRPLVAMRWIEEGRGIAPTDFNVTIENLNLPEKLVQEIKELVDSKRKGTELSKGERIPIISEFIEKELNRWETSEFPKRNVVVSSRKLDTFFRECVLEK